MRALHILAGLATLALCSVAQATEIGGTVSLELGNIHNADPAWNLFSDRDGMPSRGIRGGVRAGDHLSIQAGWHRIRRGADLSIPAVGTGAEFRKQEIRMAFFADVYSLGAQVAWPIGKFFVPYVSADGLLMRGVMKIDEDPTTRKNTNQVVGHGLAPGVMPMGGIELRTPEAPVGWLIAGFVEAGYSWFGPADFGEIGEMKPGGFAIRGGAGVRF